MTPSTLFAMANNLALPCWLLLLVAPRWRWTHRVVGGVIVGLGFSYAGLFLSQVGQFDGGYGSLGEVQRLFANPVLLTAGWVHFLAFDLFLGAWQVRDAQRTGLPHLAIVPSLVLTFLAGPVGLVLYLGLRAGLRRAWHLREAAAP